MWINQSQHQPLLLCTFLMLEAVEKYEKAFRRMEFEDKKFREKFCFSMNASAAASSIEDRYVFVEHETHASSSSECDSDPEAGVGKSNATRAGKKTKKSVHAPFSADWSNVRSFVKFLKVFFDATIKFSASTFITSNSFMWQLCVIHQQLATWRNIEDPFIFDMATVMTDKYMKYWGSYEAMNPFLFIAVLLDPREKEVGLNFRLEIFCKDDLERVAELRDCVKKVLER
ncbi:zinc finger BED domain-containing protein DAYSLEEPER-like isoform X2 [Papaver somniferum]|uniref:zinc finger BED domain-containing protein DAYSLEEPER-like isoform X2 n=1 Tax=Papaver somniferum TaxID=3469 RepID=UPI000E6FBDA0|nr:zinc finger BED domain-containing protein DAYSLEEPER-like isoform X2 [Papaver somniferum]